MQKINPNNGKIYEICAGCEAAGPEVLNLADSRPEARKAGWQSERDDGDLYCPKCWEQRHKENT